MRSCKIESTYAALQSWPTARLGQLKGSGQSTVVLPGVQLPLDEGGGVHGISMPTTHGRDHLWVVLSAVAIDISGVML